MTEPEKKVTKAAKKAVEDFEVAANGLNQCLFSEPCSAALYQQYKNDYEKAKAKLLKHLAK